MVYLENIILYIVQFECRVASLLVQAALKLAGSRFACVHILLYACSCVHVVAFAHVQLCVLWLACLVSFPDPFCRMGLGTRLNACYVFVYTRWPCMHSRCLVCTFTGTYNLWY